MRTNNIKFFRKRNAIRLMINNSRARRTYRKGKKVEAICELKVGRSYPAMDNRRNQLRLSSRLSYWFLRRLISKARRCNGIVNFKRKLCWRLGTATKLASDWLLLSMAQSGRKEVGSSTSNWFEVRDSRNLTPLSRERRFQELWNALGTGNKNWSWTNFWHVRNQIKKLHTGKNTCNTA